MANDELMRLAERVEALATDWTSIEEAEKRDAIAADLRDLAQRAPQNGAMPEGMLDLVEALDAAMVESLMRWAPQPMRWPISKMKRSRA